MPNDLVYITVEKDDDGNITAILSAFENKRDAEKYVSEWNSSPLPGEYPLSIIERLHNKRKQKYLY